MDLHGMMVMFALGLRARVLAFDIAGTGETTVPMSGAGGAEIVSGHVAHARTLGNGVVAHVGISMGGHYSARSGLAGEVDAAVVVGGHVEAAFSGEGPTRFGMAGIVGNALGFDAPPSPAQFAALFPGLSLRPLLDQDPNAPMLVINGADDVHVPQHDTLVFQGRRDTVVELIPDAPTLRDHQTAEVFSTIISWLDRRLSQA